MFQDVEERDCIIRAVKTANFVQPPYDDLKHMLAGGSLEMSERAYKLCLKLAQELPTGLQPWAHDAAFDAYKVKMYIALQGDRITTTDFDRFQGRDEFDGEGRGLQPDQIESTLRKRRDNVVVLKPRCQPHIMKETSPTLGKCPAILSGEEDAYDTMCTLIDSVLARLPAEWKCAGAPLYHLSVIFTGTNTPSHVDEPEWDGPGDVIQLLFLYGDGILLFNPLDNSSKPQSPVAMHARPGTWCAFTGALRYTHTHQVLRAAPVPVKLDGLGTPGFSMPPGTRVVLNLRWKKAPEEWIRRTNSLIYEDDTSIDLTNADSSDDAKPDKKPGRRASSRIAAAARKASKDTNVEDLTLEGSEALKTDPRMDKTGTSKRKTSTASKRKSDTELTPKKKVKQRKSATELTPKKKVKQPKFELAENDEFYSWNLVAPVQLKGTNFYSVTSMKKHKCPTLKPGIAFTLERKNKPRGKQAKRYEYFIGKVGYYRAEQGFHFVCIMTRRPYDEWPYGDWEDATCVEAIYIGGGSHYVNPILQTDVSYTDAQKKIVSWEDEMTKSKVQLKRSKAWRNYFVHELWESIPPENGSSFEDYDDYPDFDLGDPPGTPPKPDPPTGGSLVAKNRRPGPFNPLNVIGTFTGSANAGDQADLQVGEQDAVAVQTFERMLHATDFSRAFFTTGARNVDLQARLEERENKDKALAAERAAMEKVMYVYVLCYIYICIYIYIHI